MTREAKDPKKPIGQVKCPHCDRAEPAKVFRNARADRLLYYRCGEVVRGFSTGCGTVQIYGASGQQWIERNAQFFEGGDPKGSQPVEVQADLTGLEKLGDRVPVQVVKPEQAERVQTAPDPVAKKSSIWAAAVAMLGDEE
jgi:hypothetical protein